MHLCFVDESGTPAKEGQPKPCFFVMAGVVIPEERWRSVADKFQGLEVRSKYRGEVKWRYFAPGNADESNPMRAWDQPKRNQFREDFFKVLTDERSIRIVAGLCQCEAAYKLAMVNDQHDIYFRTYKVLTERFQYLLQDISKTSGRDTLGIIVADHRGTGDDDKMRKQHQRLVDQNLLHVSSYHNLVEGLFLAPSHMSVGIQFADMVAGAIWRKFEANDPYWYDRIKPSFRTSPTHAIDGYGIARFPVRGWSGAIP